MTAYELRISDLEFRRVLFRSVGVCAEAPVGPVALLPLPAVILGAGGDGRNGLLAGLIDAAGELAVDGVRPARGGDLVTGAGIARCFTGPVSEVVAVTQRNRHQQGEEIGRAQV